MLSGAEGAKGGAVEPEVPALPLAARRSAVALPTASGIRPVWAFMLAAGSIEKAPDSLNERFIAARRDGVVPKESYAILAVGNKVDAPPDHRAPKEGGEILCSGDQT